MGDIIQLREWLNEPNFKEFNYRGYHCVISRNSMSTLCGYVGVKKTNSFHNKRRGHKILDYIQVHGGITAAGYGNSAEAMKSYLWYLGFDTNHYTDYVPGYDEIKSAFGSLEKNLPDLNRDNGFLKNGKLKPYRNIEYVENQLKNMVDQIIAVNCQLYSKKLKNRA